jgi:hypothetical protein
LTFTSNAHSLLSAYRRARLVARAAVRDVVVEARQLRGVEVDALVLKRAAAVDLQCFVVGAQRAQDLSDRGGRDQVLVVDAPLEGRPCVELLKAHRGEALDLGEQIVGLDHFGGLPRGGGDNLTRFRRQGILGHREPAAPGRVMSPHPAGNRTREPWSASSHVSASRR